MNGTHPFELESFEAEGRRIVEVARGAARRILEATLAGRERIRAEAREAGRVEGHEIGVQEGRDQVAAETAPVKAILEEVATSLQRKRVELEGLAERELVGLAISIAERIVKVEVKEQADRIAPANVRRAVELAVRRHGIVVRVNPEDLVTVKAHLPGVVAAFPETEGIRLQGDETVSPGIPRVLFTGNYWGAANSEPTYDLAPDGQRFLMLKSTEATEQSSDQTLLVVVENWFEELKRLVPTE